MAAKDNHNSLLFRARSFRVSVSPERQAIGIEGLNKDGQSLVLELAGDGPANLKAEIERLFAAHPEMSNWKSPGLQ